MRKKEPIEEVSAPVEETSNYPLWRLRQECQELFGVTQSVFDGATYGHSGEHSVEQMRRKIAQWQNKGISIPKNR